MKIVYKSDDGKEFNTQEECQKYESNNDVRNELSDFIERFTWESEYISGSIMDTEDCVNMIIENIDLIISIVKKDNYAKPT